MICQSLQELEMFLENPSHYIASSDGKRLVRSSDEQSARLLKASKKSSSRDSSVPEQQARPAKRRSDPTLHDISNSKSPRAEKEKVSPPPRKSQPSAAPPSTSPHLSRPAPHPASPASPLRPRSAPKAPATPRTEFGPARNVRGESPLHVACIKGKFDMLEAVLREGAIDINAKDNAGWTALHEACNHGYANFAELLLQHGADVNMPGDSNITPLHDAACSGKTDVVKVLLAWGADINALDRRGMRPIDLCEPDSADILDLLEKAEKSPPVASASKAAATRARLNRTLSTVVIATTGLSTEEKIIFQECASSLNVFVLDDITPSGPGPTHLVMSPSKPCAARTLKYLQCVVRGCWIVTLNWLQASAKAKKLIYEESFEVRGDSVAIGAPTKARINASKRLPGLFDGCQLYIQGVTESGLSRASLEELVVAGGGKVFHRDPRGATIPTAPFHARDRAVWPPVTVHLADTDWDTSDGCRHADADWLLDCISHFAILPCPARVS